MIEKALYTPTEVSELLGVSKGTLARWRMEGKDLQYCKLGRLVRYRVCDVKDYLEKSKV